MNLGLIEVITSIVLASLCGSADTKAKERKKILEKIIILQ